jgi:selenocysteine-specific elongation factor
MRRFVIGTAGHVDHGKTTLVRALTGIDTDRLPEEKQRGISIELGFAPLDLGDLHASIVDVPGHRRLVRTMIAGAAGMELVMLVVAADEGVMPQTREHVAVCELLGLRRAVVVVNKADAVDPELAALAGEEARDLLGARWQADVVLCSARTGAGLDRLREALRSALASLPPSLPPGHVRLGVDRVFSIRGAGTVVTGTLVTGKIASGDPLFLVGERQSLATSARALHVHDRPVDRAEAPTRIAINLAGLALEDVRRGDVVTSDPHLRATTLIDVRLHGAHSLKRGAALTAHIGTASTAARVDSLLDWDGGVVARVRMAHATPLAGGDRIVLRGGASGLSGAVAGGGQVIDARPDRRASGARRRALAAALCSLDPAETTRALVAAIAPRPLLRSILESRFAVGAGRLEEAADADPTLVRVQEQSHDHAWIARVQLDAAVARARQLVREHHDRAPLDRGMPLETLRARLATAGGRVVGAEVIRVAGAEGPMLERLVVDGDVVRVGQRPAESEQRATRRTDPLARELTTAGVAGITEFTLAQRTSIQGGDLRAALQKLARDGAAVRLGELWFATETIAEARRLLLAHFASQGPRGSVSVVQFKEIAGLARKQAVAMLEHFDQVGLTRRQGDARVLR